MKLPRGDRTRTLAPGHGGVTGRVPKSPGTGLAPEQRPGGEGARPSTSPLAGRLLAWLLGLSLLTASSTCLGRTPHEDREAELQSLRRQIATLTKHLNQARSTESAVQRELRTTETNIGEIAREIRHIGRQLSAAEGRLAELHREKEQLAANLVTQRQTLAKQVRAAYITGRQDYLKLLLNQENPAALKRVLTYYRYFSHARAEQIQRVEAELLELEAVQRDISRQ